MKRICLFNLCVFLLCGLAVSATANPSRREQIIQDLGLQARPLPIKTQDGQNAQPPVVPVADVAGTTVTNVPIHQKSVTTDRTAPIADFTLSAPDYLALRGPQPLRQTLLVYSLSLQKMNGQKVGENKTIRLNIGDDFVAIDNGKATKIYDFKLNRILSVTPRPRPAKGQMKTAAIFDNQSLFAKVYVNIFRINQATAGGSRTSLQLSKTLSLESFWIESALSWAVRADDTGMNIAKADTALTIRRKGKEIYKARFDAHDFASPARRDAFLAFAHHEWPLHPLVLQKLYTYNAPPKSQTILTYSPSFPNGMRQVWTLSDRQEIRATFPLPKTASGPTEHAPLSPLDLIMRDAARNQARGGFVRAEDIMQKAKDALSRQHYKTAWVQAMRVLDYTNARCSDMPLPPACDIIEAAAKAGQAEKDPVFSLYLKAASARETQTDLARARLIKTLKPVLQKPDTPALLFRWAAMARARMKTARARLYGVEDVKPADLLELSLAKDPYVPQTWIGLAQVLAAKREIVQSWNLYDVLRAEIPTAPKPPLKIDLLEQKLRRMAPGYFLH